MLYVNKPMQCTTNLTRDIMELFCAGDVNRPTTRLLALASVAATCNRYPQATTTVLINVFYPECMPLILVKTQIIWLKSTKSGPVGFEKIDFLHFSPCSMQWMFQTPGVSIFHVKKTCHTILFSFRVVGPQSWVLRVTKLSRFLRYPQDTSHFLYFFMYK